MVTVAAAAAAAAIAGSARQAIKWTSRVVVGEYSIIELSIHVAIYYVMIIKRDGDICSFLPSAVPLVVSLLSQSVTNEPT